MDDRRGTLVILTPAFPRDETETHWVPTQQLFVKTLTASFPDVRIEVLTFYHPGHRGSYDWRGLKVTSFDGSRQRGVRRPFFYRDIWKTLQDIRRESPILGLLSFWCGECALLGHYFGKRYGIRHLCWLCGGDARASNRLVRFIRPRPEELIAMSDFLVREFEKNHGVRPAHMITNAIDPTVFPPLSGTERDIDILGVGSLSRLKRYDLFVGVVRALRASFPNAQAVLCGDGEERERLLAMKGAEDHIRLVGEKPHREALGLMQRAKVFLHTSDYEGFGVVCLEALYAGARVLSFTKPLDQALPRWETVTTLEGMIRRAAQLLSEPDPSPGPVLV